MSPTAVSGAACLPACVCLPHTHVYRTLQWGEGGAKELVLAGAQLNALASRFARGTRRGDILLNGTRFTEDDFRAFGVYVMQAEPLLATATVRQPATGSCFLGFLSITLRQGGPIRCIGAGWLSCPASGQVRETIETSALLRLPLSVSREEKEQVVEEIICQLVSTPACPTRSHIQAWLACPARAVRVGRQFCQWLAHYGHRLAQSAVLEARAAVRAG